MYFRTSQRLYRPLIEVKGLILFLQRKLSLGIRIRIWKVSKKKLDPDPHKMNADTKSYFMLPAAYPQATDQSKNRQRMHSTVLVQFSPRSGITM